MVDWTALTSEVLPEFKPPREVFSLNALNVFFPGFDDDFFEAGFTELMTPLTDGLGRALDVPSLGASGKYSYKVPD